MQLGEYTLLVILFCILIYSEIEYRHRMIESLRELRNSVALVKMVLIFEKKNI